MNFRYFKFRMFAAAVALTACATLGVSCADDIEVGVPADDSFYGTIYETNGYLLDRESNQSVVTITPTGKSYTATLSLGLTRVLEGALSAKASFDAGYLETYNAANGTEYALYPENLVTFADDGVFVADATDKKRATVEMTVAPSTELKAGVTYAIPVAVSAEGLTLKDEARHCLYLINGDTEQSGNIGTCDKGEGKPKGFLFFEANDTNPLNALAFKLDNGKLLWDVVVLFAANINWDASAGRVYLNRNANIQYLLDNNETYLQPLRKRGIKVLLGLLGNHDQAGLAQLSEIGAREYAAELANYIYAYNLDGVNFDNEYSLAPDLSNPYFTSPSTTAAARLCYETKKAMPDKLVTVYDYGGMYGIPEVEGSDVDEWLDAVVADYGRTSYPIGNMSYAKCSGLSMEFARGSGGSLNSYTAQNILNTGYGWFMGFALDPVRFPSVYSRLSQGIPVLYDGAQLVYPSVFYRKNDPTPYVYPDDL